ncbi:MAG TPA: ADP-ribosylglycohydrolase family protein [Chthoniobacteraceae bacterium]|nr:ADP-ribosylglycohydrolase family protein [Chthoniobacteraceae bacterium]
MTSTSIADRAAGCIVGAFIGDALGLGPHWYYNLDQLRRDFGEWIDGYTAPRTHAKYHRGMKAGELSQTGIIMLLLLRSVAQRGAYDEKDFTQRLDDELLPKLNGEAFAGPGGYTNHSFRQVWQARVREGKSWGETGGNADTSEAAERVSIIAARHALNPYLAAKHANDCCRLSQIDSLVGQQTVAFACVLATLIRGEAFDEELSDKLMDLLSSGEIPFTAKSSSAAADTDSPSLGFASPDALLLPSWIAEAANDPGIRIDPPWKVSLVYGMSCAINVVLPAAYYLAARFPGDFEDAVLHAINGGGQNMSRACLTGALVGAQVGLSGIPERLVSGLADGEEIVALAQKVASSTTKETKP